MERSTPAFYVVQFLELPFESIDDYVCVPSSWLKAHRASDQKASVAYPKGEDPFDTRDRAKRKERYDDEWRCYMAVVKYQTDSYSDAELWIATRNNHGPLVEVESNQTRTQPRFTLNRRLRTANQSLSSNLNDNPPEPLLNISMKRPALSEPKKKLGGKRLKLDVATPSLFSTVVNEAGCSKSEQSIIIQENQSMEFVQTRENSGASSYYRSSSTQNTDENLQKSVPKQEQKKLPVVTQDQSENDQRAQGMRCGNRRGQTSSLDSIANSSKRIQHIPKANIRKSHDGAVVSAWDVIVNNILSASQNLLRASHQRLNFNKRLDGQQSSPTQEQYITHSHQNQYLPTNQNSFEHELYRRSTETNNYGHRPNSHSIGMRIPSIRQTLSDSSNPLHQTSEVLDQRQAQLNQQDTQRKTKKPKLRICISIKPKQNRQKLNLQGVTKRTPPLQVSESALVNESHRNAIDNKRQKHYAVTSNSDAVTNAGQEMTPGEAPVETTNNVFCAGNTSRSHSADRRMAAQNLMTSNQQTHPKVVFGQQMLNHFAASNLSLSSNLTPEIPQITEERHIEVKVRTNANNEDQHIVYVANNTPKKQNNLWRFVLPPQYDPHDTRWTLKYKTNLPGLVELMPQSGIYVSYGDLQYCKHASKDCKSLALLLLPEVFNKEALSVCLSMSESAQDSYKDGSNGRPELDKHASAALLRFVFEFGVQHGWEFDPQLILGNLHRKIQMIRFKYGVMVKY